MALKTERLILRPFTEDDAPDLYAASCDCRVGHSAGWEPHKNVEESLEIIRTVFSAPNSCPTIIEIALPIDRNTTLNKLDTVLEILSPATTDKPLIE